MGRASNRKKAQRQAGGPNLRRIKQDARSRAVATRSAFGLDAMVQLAKERVERRNEALQAWSGDSEPVSAETPPWPKGSLGHRLLVGTQLMEAQDAPSLLTAQIPHPQLIAADPTHWAIATSALIRSVVFDGLTPGHPAVSTLLAALAPVVEDELAYMRTAGDREYSIGSFDNDDGEDFPELDGPVFLLGRALVEAVWTVIGDDSISDVLSVLLPALDGVVPGLAAPFLTDALIAAFAADYRCEDPADGEILQRVGHLGGNALETLVDAGAVEPSDVLPAGLLVLAALARLCQSDSDSVLQPAPDAGT